MLATQVRCEWRAQLYNGLPLQSLNGRRLDVCWVCTLPTTELLSNNIYFWLLWIWFGKIFFLVKHYFPSVLKSIHRGWVRHVAMLIGAQARLTRDSITRVKVFPCQKRKWEKLWWNVIYQCLTDNKHISLFLRIDCLQTKVFTYKT